MVRTQFQDIVLGADQLDIVYFRIQKLNIREIFP